MPAVLSTRRALALVATAVLGLTLAQPSGIAAAEAGRARATATTVTTTPAQLTGYVANSLRGEYAWSLQAAPDGKPTPDVYFRDQIPWNQIEGTQGTYDLSSIDWGLAEADARGGRFGMRVLAWCPGCWSNQYKPYSQAPAWVPTWLPKQAGTDIPDWNSPAFLAAWDTLWQQLGAHYASDPRLGWIDIGGYGAWGEWHVPEGQAITAENAKRMARAVLDNFPDTHVVVNAMDPTLVNAVLAMSPRVGLRTDCLGEYQMFSLIPSSAPGSLIAERWKTAPVLSEWCHTGATSMVRGAKQVRTYHVSMTSSGNTWQEYAAMSPTQQQGFRQAARDAGYRYAVTSVTTPRSVTHAQPFDLRVAVRNSGSAPTYDAWDLVLQTLDSAGSVVQEQTLPADLRTVLPGTRSWLRTVTAPDAAGSYRLRLVVRDHAGHLAPMALANTGRSASGSYPLAALTVK